jgi:3-deoxy-7-phosphoheptulonate synthase
MIIVMKENANEKDIDYVIGRASSLGFKTHISQNKGQKLISLLGDLQALSPSALAGLRGVERVVPLRHPFRLASRDFKPERTIIPINDYCIGGDQIIVMAGPCAVESKYQLMEAAQAVKQAGASMLRGGAFKPRTSPYSFQGLGEEGLKILAEARQATGLPIITEVMSPEQVPLVSSYADVLQVGARNIQNFNLLHAVGKSDKPVLLKRGMTSTVEELLLSAEYILSHGNQNVILCERGIRTFETYTRNTLDIEAVPLLKELTHLPVVVDPSHATGKASLVKSVSKAGVAAGADGLLIEVHPNPADALSDGHQSLTPRQFMELMEEVKLIAQAVGRSLRVSEEL